MCSDIDSDAVSRDDLEAYMYEPVLNWWRGPQCVSHYGTERGNYGRDVLALALGKAI